MPQLRDPIDVLLFTDIKAQLSSLIKRLYSVFTVAGGQFSLIEYLQQVTQ